MNRTRYHYIYIIPISIFVVKILEFLFRLFDIKLASFADGSGFLSNFIEWFGVIYGLLLPLIMVRVWEQLDSIDREFDREADAVKALYEDIFFLGGKCAEIGKEIAPLLRGYVDHVIKQYSQEVKVSNNFQDLPESILFREISEQLQKLTQGFFKLLGKFLDLLKRLFRSGDSVLQGKEIYKQIPLPTISETDDQKKIGDQLLEYVRHKFRDFFAPNAMTTKASEILVEEMFHRLNEIIDIRGDRIALASQRLFETLRIVALITSIIFLLPFYFVGFTPQTHLLDEILIGAITLLVIFIYLIVEDLDEPFGGIWKIEATSWERLLSEMDSTERKVELENLAKDEFGVVPSIDNYFNGRKISNRPSSLHRGSESLKRRLKSSKTMHYKGFQDNKLTTTSTTKVKVKAAATNPKNEGLDGKKPSKKNDLLTKTVSSKATKVKKRKTL